MTLEPVIDFDARGKLCPVHGGSHDPAESKCKDETALYSDSQLNLSHPEALLGALTGTNSVHPPCCPLQGHDTVAVLKFSHESLL